MTAQAFMAEHVERMGLSMAHFIASTDPELLSQNLPTKSDIPARSVLEMVAECASANRYFAALLNGGTPGQPAIQTFTDSEDARDEIMASANVLADAIKQTADSALDQEFMHWSRGPLTGNILLMGAYRNMAYHSGQINFIQILNGDHEFHVPSTWLK